MHNTYFHVCLLYCCCCSILKGAQTVMTQLLSEPKVRTYANSSAVYGPPGGYSPFQVQVMPPMLPMAMVNMGRPNQYMPPTPAMPAVNPAMMSVPAPGTMKMTPGAVGTPYMVRTTQYICICLSVYSYFRN